MIVVALGVMLASGCSTETRYRYMSKIFEDEPKPGERVKPPQPVVHAARRQPYKKPAPPPVVGWSPPPEKPNWRQILGELPKTEAGGVDWVNALEEKLIQPKPGLEPDAADQPPFDLTLELIPEGQPLFKVTYPHKQHTEWLGCANCHTGIFKMQRGGDPITMAKIFAGEYCGRCHGKVAFAPATGCPRCHLALATPK
jgi:c(7)-type cytochrome triheme protein